MNQDFLSQFDQAFCFNDNNQLRNGQLSPPYSISSSSSFDEHVPCEVKEIPQPVTAEFEINEILKNCTTKNRK